MKKVFVSKWLIDGKSDDAKEGFAVVINGNLIEDIIPSGDLSGLTDIEKLEFKDHTIVPGLINNHVHLVLPGDKTPFPMSQLDSEAGMTIRAAHNIHTSLKSGVTWVRDCGGKGTITTELRDAQKKGDIPGSRMFCCGWPLTITGGHVRYFGGEVDGIDALTVMIRRIVGLGADFVKLMASGGGTPGSVSHYPAFTLEELKHIVHLSHDFGKPVAAHCIATASIERAVDAKVDMIEHALFFNTTPAMEFDDRVADKLAESGIPVTTTLSPFSDVLDVTKPGDPDYERRSRQLAKQYEFFAKMKEKGIKLVAGSDAGWLASPFDGFWKELYELTNCGLTAMEAVKAGTILPAQVLNLDGQYGSIEKGKVADFLIVQGNVESEIRNIRNVTQVVQDGRMFL